LETLFTDEMAFPSQLETLFTNETAFQRSWKRFSQMKRPFIAVGNAFHG
jgi:hypothetical protein